MIVIRLNNNIIIQIDYITFKSFDFLKIISLIFIIQNKYILVIKPFIQDLVSIIIISRILNSNYSIFFIY